MEIKQELYIIHVNLSKRLLLVPIWDSTGTKNTIFNKKVKNTRIFLSRFSNCFKHLVSHWVSQTRIGPEERFKRRPKKNCFCFPFLFFKEPRLFHSCSIAQTMMLLEQWYHESGFGLGILILLCNTSSGCVCVYILNLVF